MPGLRALRRAAPPFLALLPSLAFGGLYGKAELLMQTDNRVHGGEGMMEGRGDLAWDDGHGMSGGLSLALRRRDGSGESHLYQLFVARRIELDPQGQHLQLAVGRLQRADALGLYTLDGATAAWQGKTMTFQAYAGRPRRMEDYRGVSAQALYGIDAHYRLPANAVPGRARLGWQRLMDGEHADRLNFGWQSAAVGRLPATLLQGFWLPGGSRLQDLQARIEGDLDKRTFARLEFESYRPDQRRLDFRERFYLHYALGEQRSLRAELQRRFAGAMRGLLRLSRVWRDDPRGEMRDRGHGLAAELDGRLPRGPFWRARLDHLQLEMDRRSALYLQGDGALDATRRLSLRAVLQWQDSALGGQNRALGLEAQAEQMLRGNLYASAFLSLIHNTRLADEYRAGLRLSWRLDDRLREVLP